jgi:hypothetical protein
MPAVVGRSRKRPGQAAGERRGEGEPELERRSAPSHPLKLCVYGLIAQADVTASVGVKRRDLFGEQAAEYRARELLGTSLKSRFDLFAFEDAEEEDDGTCEQRDNGDEEEPEEGSWIEEGKHVREL